MMTTLATIPQSRVDPGSALPVEDAPRTDDIPVLEMIEPLLGFPGQERFALIRLDDAGVVCELRSLDDEALRFVVVPPGPFFPDYAPHVDDTTAEALAATSAEDLLTLVMVNAGETPEAATANLLAPVLVNHHTRKALQVVLHDEDLSLRAPLVRR